MEYTLDELLKALPKTGDGVPIVPGIIVYCIVGKRIDEREVIAPYGKKALLTHEPSQHGTCAGQSHRLAFTVFSTREAAEFACSNDRAIREIIMKDTFE